MTDPMQWLRQQITDKRRLAEASLMEGAENDEGNPPWEIHDGAIWSDYTVAVGPSDHPIAEHDARHIVANDPRQVIAMCDSHDAILDEVAKLGTPVIEIDNPFDTGVLSTLFTSLAAQELLRHVGIAYRRHPGYDGFVAALAAPEVKVQLSDVAKADELTPRRQRRQDDRS